MAGEGGVGGTRGMCLIEKRSQSMLLSSIEGSAGRSWGWYLKSYFPLSPSLTRMHDKAFCQQGQEEGSQLLPQSQSGYLESLTTLCRKRNLFFPRFHYNWGPSQTQVYVLCVMDFFFSFFGHSFSWHCYGALLSQPLTSAKLSSQTEHKSRNEKLFRASENTDICAHKQFSISLREPRKTLWNGKNQHRIIPTPRDLCCLKVFPS